MKNLPMSNEPVFVGYEKMAERPAEWKLDEAAYHTLTRKEWVVTEKIHGANFVVLTNGQDVWFAKRKSLLKPDDEFFGYQLLVPHLSEKVRRLFVALKTKHPSLTQVAVHGELFGGSYPHPYVKPDPRVEAVQTGIHYSPTIEFCVFDLAILCDGEERTFLDFRTACELAEAAGLLFTQSLMIGSYQKAIDYPLGFDSTLPALIGLPPLSMPNKAEGIVVKILDSFVTLADGRRIRPMIKKKIPEFAEDPRFQEAQKWKRSVGPMIQEERAALELLKQEVLRQVTPARFHNAESKIGRVRHVQSPQADDVVALLCDDLHDQLRLDQLDILQLLSPLVQKELDVFINSTARDLIEKEIGKSINDGV